MPADLGYRVAQHAAGRGVATATVRELCRLAATRYGLDTLCAATSHENTASQRGPDQNSAAPRSKSSNCCLRSSPPP